MKPGHPPAGPCSVFDLHAAISFERTQPILNQSFGELNIQAYAPHHPEGVVRTCLFDHEDLRAELVTMPPGSEIPLHVHEHAHELFDVIAGRGCILVAGQELPGAPGKCVLVAAGTPHGLRNDSDGLWTVRVTYQERVYARQVGKLVGRAVRKRLGLA